MSKIVIDVEEDFHRAVRIEAIKHGETMKDFIVNTVSNAIRPASNINTSFKAELKESIKENESILRELVDK